MQHFKQEAHEHFREIHFRFSVMPLSKTRLEILINIVSPENKVTDCLKWFTWFKCVSWIKCYINLIVLFACRMAELMCFYLCEYFAFE